MDHEQHHQPPSFHEGVTEIMMACEELRQRFKTSATTEHTLSTDVVVNGREDLDVIFGNIGELHHQIAAAGVGGGESGGGGGGAAVDDVHRDLFQHCQQRVAHVAQLVLDQIMKNPEPAEEETPNNIDLEDPIEQQKLQERQQQLEMDRREFQASLARIVELNFIFCIETQNTKQIDTIIEAYVAFQRNALRERCKPYIARLVQERRNPGAYATERLPHSNVLTVILGQASALIHPLLAWLFSLPPPPESNQIENKLVESIRKLCTDAVVTLDEQAQTLSKTVSDWFWPDRNVDDWMTKSNNNEDENSKNTSDGLTNDNHKVYLGELDSLVEEMAFVCQVLARYLVLIQDVPQELQTIISLELSPEWTWKYASLERFLAMQQWKSAVSLAAPVNIILGTSIQVPSVVEDAQYLSTRALERAASTRSAQAIGTLAHSISSHVWSIDMTGGVHEALLNQVGCYVDEKTQLESQRTKNTKSPPKTDDFASALLGALDDDIGEHDNIPPKPPRSGPASGGLFHTLVAGGSESLQQIRLNTDFCTLNGIFSASTACRSLVKFLDGLLENADSYLANETGQPAASNQQTNAMISLAREELSNFGVGYDRMLKAQVQRVLQQYCGGLQGPPSRKNSLCIPALRNYFDTESFELDQATFKQAEADDRLERDLLGPFQDSKFLKQSPDRCEADVLFRIREEITLLLVELVLDCLLHSTPPKRFTDWGSLLLAKQIRMLQTFLNNLQEKSSSGNAMTQNVIDSKASTEAWERLSQVATVLQLERPSDWTLYKPTSVLTKQDLRQAMQLRVDFSLDAISAVAGPPEVPAPDASAPASDQNAMQL